MCFGLLYPSAWVGEMFFASAWSVRQLWLRHLAAAWHMASPPWVVPNALRVSWHTYGESMKITSLPGQIWSTHFQTALFNGYVLNYREICVNPCESPIRTMVSEWCLIVGGRDLPTPGGYGLILLHPWGWISTQSSLLFWCQWLSMPLREVISIVILQFLKKSRSLSARFLKYL